MDSWHKILNENILKVFRAEWVNAYPGDFQLIMMTQGRGIWPKNGIHLIISWGKSAISWVVVLVVVGVGGAGRGCRIPLTGTRQSAFWLFVCVFYHYYYYYYYYYFYFYLLFFALRLYGSVSSLSSLRAVTLPNHIFFFFFFFSPPSG